MRADWVSDFQFSGPLGQCENPPRGGAPDTLLRPAPVAVIKMPSNLHRVTRSRTYPALARVEGGIRDR